MFQHHQNLVNNVVKVVSTQFNFLFFFKKEDVKFPSRISDKAKSILSGLLCKDPTVRLGGKANDAKDVMGHPFFDNTNWDDIYHKKVFTTVFIRFDKRTIFFPARLQ